MRQEDCKGCSHIQKCDYAYLFETPLPRWSDRMRKQASVTRPYTFFPGVPRTLQDGDRKIDVAESFELTLQLFGRSADYLSQVIHALRCAGQQGLGKALDKGFGRFDLAGVDQLVFSGGQWQSILSAQQRLQAAPPISPKIPAMPDRVDFRLITPLRLSESNKVNGKNQLVRAEHFAFHHLYRSVMRRIAMLSYFHQRRDLVLEFDLETLGRASREVDLVTSDLHWYDWQRRSSRQQKNIDMSGLLGSFAVKNLPVELWPWLWLGQWTHAGKSTTSGLGAYRLDIT